MALVMCVYALLRGLGYGGSISESSVSDLLYLPTSVGNWFLASHCCFVG